MIHDSFILPDDFINASAFAFPGIDSGDDEDIMPLVERSGNRPIIRRAIRQWINDRIALGDSRERIHTSSFLLLCIVDMFGRDFGHLFF